MCHLARSSPEAAYLPLWGVLTWGTGAGPPGPGPAQSRRLQPWGPCRWRTHRQEPMGTPPASPLAEGLEIQYSRFPGPVGQTDSNCSRQLLAGLPPMDVGITGIMPPEVRGVAAQGSPAALRIEPVGKPPSGSATRPFLRSLLEIAADAPAMEPLPLPGHGAGPTGQHRRGKEIDDQAAEGLVFRPFQTAFQDVHQFIGLHRGYSPLRLS